MRKGLLAALSTKEKRQPSTSVQGSKGRLTAGKTIVSLIPKCNTTPTQRYLYPWGADGEAEVVQWGERFGCSLWTIQTGIKTLQDTHRYASKEVIDAVARTHRQRTQFIGMLSRFWVPSGKFCRRARWDQKTAKGTDLREQNNFEKKKNPNKQQNQRGT